MNMLAGLLDIVGAVLLLGAWLLHWDTVAAGIIVLVVSFGLMALSRILRIP